MLDVGAGTGIATRLLRRVAGQTPVIAGVEPSRDMLRAAARGSPAQLRIHWIRGRAELSAGSERVQAELAELVAAHADADGAVTVPFQTELFLAVKPSSD
jgi:trans-aconitate methyltransferase